MAVLLSILLKPQAKVEPDPSRTQEFIRKAFTPLRVSLTSMLILLFVLLPSVGLAGILRPLEGEGNFHSYFDVVNRWQGPDNLNVLVLVEIANDALNYEVKGNDYVGKFNFEIILEGPAGEIVTKKKHMRTDRLDKVLAGSNTAHQSFGLILENVPFRQGKLTCRIKDALKSKKGVMNHHNLASSEIVLDWNAETEIRVEGGITVGDPLFLAHAPLKSWSPTEMAKGAQGGYLHDYIHPSRRYGLEQDSLQLFIPVWPSLGLGNDPDQYNGLQIQIVSLDMAYSITDTIEFNKTGITALKSGRPAGLVYELDLNILPEGAYRLGLAPLNKKGRGQIVNFDVVWRLSNLAHDRDHVLGEGRLVFVDRELDEFLAASPGEQGVILEDFWASLDPDPENLINSVYLEFLKRKAHVRNFLGGFGAYGAIDPRGEIYLLMGPPDDIERNVMPMNSGQIEDARTKTFQRFAPDQNSTYFTDSNSHIQGLSDNPQSDPGGNPMADSYNGDMQNMLSKNSPMNSHGYELWQYDSGGKPLFDNYLEDHKVWQRFLFVDWSGNGDYHLQSSNVFTADD